MELTALVPSLKRAVAAPGEFDTFFPNSSETDLVGSLTDAVAEAMLDGFLAATDLDLENGVVTPDLSHQAQALVVLYGAARILSARIANLKNRTRYVAGPAEAETEQSASVLVELLRQVNARKKQVLDDARAGDLATAFEMVDMYVAKSIDVGTTDVNYISSRGAVGYYSGSRDV
jgi:hypothetical protein